LSPEDGPHLRSSPGRRIKLSLVRQGGTPPHIPSWSQETTLTCPQRRGSHLSRIVGTRQPSCLVPAGGDPTSTPSSPLRPHAGHRGCLLCPHGETSISCPIPFTEDPLALSPWGRAHLELHCCPLNPIPVSEDPLAWIPRVGSHLKLQHCPSNPICVTEAPLAVSP